MKRTRFNFLTAASIFTVLAFTACDSNDDMEQPNDGSEKGTANISATDAAVDAENITGVFLNVKGISVDGVDDANDAELMFDATQEFNLMAYQNGDTYALGSIDLNAGSYSSINFILDEEMPAYVKYTDNTTADVSINAQEDMYEIVGDFEIMAESQTDLVADIDLRKALVKSSNEGEFMLRSTARLVNANFAGTINGTVENYDEMKAKMENQDVDAKFVVFAYAEGMYNESEQEEGSGLNGRFENAINSAVVAEDGSFTIAFMEEADYEIVIGSFTKPEQAPEEESFEFDTLVETELAAGGSVGLILDILGVKANSSTTVSLNFELGS